METGKLNYRIVFEDRVNEIDEYGNIKHPDDWGGVTTDSVWQVVNIWQLTSVWTLTSTESEAALWAAFAPRFGREMFESAQLSNKVKGVVTIRQHPSATMVVLPSFRVRFLSGPYKGKNFNILSVTPLSNRAFVEVSIEESNP